jgi:hypothetical protein
LITIITKTVSAPKAEPPAVGWELVFETYRRHLAGCPERILRSATVVFEWLLEGEEIAARCHHDSRRDGGGTLFSFSLPQFGDIIQPVRKRKECK